MRLEGLKKSVFTAERILYHFDGLVELHQEIPMVFAANQIEGQRIVEGRVEYAEVLNEATNGQLNRFLTAFVVD